jgi:hypothetical protein
VVAFSCSGAKTFSIPEKPETLEMNVNGSVRFWIYLQNFIISTIYALQNDNAKFLERVENREVFWASPGSYLRKSTLVSLARNISGLELPPSLYQDTTFGSIDDSVDSTPITQQLIDATIESSRRPEDDDDDMTD